MPNQSPALDRTFQALADPTRRAVVERLGRGPATVSDLAEPFSMALPSFLQHLNVLEASGLITSRKHGRVRTCELSRQTLAAMEDWLIRQRVMWEERLDRLDETLLDLHDRDQRR